MKWSMLTPVLMALAGGIAGAQVHRYEVAVIKPIGMAPPAVGLSLGTNDGGRFVSKAVSLQVLIQFAYDVLRYQIVGAPAWVADDAFAVEARPDTPFSPTVVEVKEMVRGLLEERFGLRVKRETREATVYNLVVAKGGPRFQATTAPAAQRIMSGGLGFVKGKGLRLGSLVQTISSQLERPVFDRTGLDGEFDIDLHWTPAGRETADSTEPNLIGALNEQLGLKLETAKGSIETLVIVAVEKPTN